MAKRKNPESTILTRQVEIKLSAYNATNLCTAAVQYLLDYCPKKLQWPELKEFRTRELDPMDLTAELSNQQLFAMVDAVMPASIGHVMLDELAYGITHDFEDDYTVDFAPAHEIVVKYVKENLTAAMQKMIDADRKVDDAEEQQRQNERVSQRKTEIESAVALLRSTGEWAVSKKKDGDEPAPKKTKARAMAMLAPTSADVLQMETFRQLIVAAARHEGCEAKRVYKSETADYLRIKLYNVGTKKQVERIGQLLKRAGLTMQETMRAVGDRVSLTIRIPAGQVDWHFMSVCKSLAAAMAK